MQELATLRAQAEAGQPQAQYDLAMRLSASSSEAEKAQTEHWLTEACRNRHPTAMFTLSGILLSQQPDEDDQAQKANIGIAIKLLELAETSPDATPEVLHRIGQMHLLGCTGAHGESILPADVSRGVRVLNAAAERGSSDSICVLAELLIAKEHSQANIEQSVALYTRAAEMGNAEAQERLGRFYSGGEFCEPDHAKAFFWYSKAAEGGNASAQYNVSFYYVHGLTGAGVDYQKAFHWCNLAAHQGYADAQHFLGIMHERGDASAPNRVLALEWYEKAAASGHQKAAEEARRLRDFELNAIPDGFAADVARLRVRMESEDPVGLVRQAFLLTHGYHATERSPAHALPIYMATAPKFLISRIRLWIAFSEGIRTPRSSVAALLWAGMVEQSVPGIADWEEFKQCINQTASDTQRESQSGAFYRLAHRFQQDPHGESAVYTLVFMSAEAGNRIAQRNAGQMIAAMDEQGDLGRDLRVARRYFELAIEQGDEESKPLLAILIKDNSHNTTKRAAATKQLKTSARRGNNAARKAPESLKRGKKSNNQQS